MALNAKLRNEFEHLSEECGYEHLREKWLWTLMKEMTLNAYENCGFERLN